ncbi:MAG: sulfatase [Planctomycetes bacterium]|nr:sulfatase [Planctomycetota bacterium]
MCRLRSLRYRATAAVALSAVIGGCGRRVAETPNVILVTVDTLRRDHLDLYGYARSTAPNVTALAREGVTFDDAVTPLPKTAPALASLMTGLYPSTHNVQVNFGSRLDEKFTTLAEILSQRGFDTAAFVSNVVLARAGESPAGLDRGFRVYDDVLTTAESPARAGILERRAAATTDAALAWVSVRSGQTSAGAPARPLFLWVHYIDPHGLYDPPEPQRSRFKSPAPRWTTDSDIDTDAPGHVGFVNPANVLDGDPNRAAGHDVALHIDRYDGEVAYADTEIGRLLRELERIGIAEGALIVFAADHGESFGEHHVFFDHGFDVYDENVRIPLVMRFSGKLPRGRRVAGSAQLGDVMPTVLELLDVPIPAAIEGTSLAPTARGGAAIPSDREIHVETNEGSLSLGTYPRGVRTTRWKCVVTFEAGLVEGEYDVAARELYDLVRDPRETTNVFDANGEIGRTLEGSIRRMTFPPKRDVAAQSLAYFGGKSVDRLGAAIDDWRGHGGAGGAGSLLALGSDAVPAISAALARETDASLVAAEGQALQALATGKQARIVAKALRVAATADRDAPEAALRATLQSLAPPKVIASVGPLLESDGDARVRRAAVRVFDHPALRAALPRVVHALDDRDPGVRLAAVDALLAFPLPLDRAEAASAMVARLSIENDDADRDEQVIGALVSALFDCSGRNRQVFGPLAPADDGGAPPPLDRDAVRRALPALRAAFKRA